MISGKKTLFGEIIRVLSLQIADNVNISRNLHSIRYNILTSVRESLKYYEPHYNKNGLRDTDSH